MARWTTVYDTIAEIRKITEDKYEIKINVPTERPNQFPRQDIPVLPREEFEIVLPHFYEQLRAMRLEIFMGKEGDRKVATFMPAVLLHSWHQEYLTLEPDHSELAQIQHNWKKSTATASDCLKEGLVFMGVSISFVCYAVLLHGGSFHDHVFDGFHRCCIFCR